MPTLNSAVKFAFGEQANFTSLQSKDLSTIYFCTDTARLFLGETEYTRPIQYGSALPVGFLPPNSLFVLEGNDGEGHVTRDLFFSKDGASWQPVAHINEAVLNTSDKTLGIIDAGTYGDSTKTVDFGDTIIIPKVTVDSKGAITAIENSTITLPNAPEDAEITITPATAGGTVVTSVIKTPETTTGVTVGYTTPGGSVVEAPSATVFVTNVTLGDDLQLEGTTQTADTNVATGTSIPTTAAVKFYVDTQDAATLQDAKDYADGILAANDAMVFKGTVGGADSGATVTDFGALTDYKTGWTYRVIEAGTYAGSDCEVGDLLIAVADYATSFKNGDWTIAQTNIDGAVISSATLTDSTVILGAGGQNVKSLANGTVGQVLKIGENGPEWGTDNNDNDNYTYSLSSTAADNTATITLTGANGGATTSTTIKPTTTGELTISADSTNGITIGVGTIDSSKIQGDIEASSVDWANVQDRPTISLTGDVTGSINLETGAAVTTAIGAGVIVDADINANAAIAQSKISGLTTALAGKVDNTVEVNGQPLTGDVTITDVTGNAGTADALKTPRQFSITGGATAAAVEFDGSANVALNVTALNAGVLNGQIPAAVTMVSTPASSSNDTTIATTAFVTNAVSAATLTWGSFDPAG